MGQLKVNVAGVWTPVGGGGGGGSGSDEVAIGPDDPIATAPTTELWYDTDEPATLTDDVRWNTAWGYIGFGIHTANYQPSTAGIWYDVPNLSITWNAIAGRRYKTTVSTIAQKTVATGDMFIRLVDLVPTHLTGTSESATPGSYGSMTLEYIENILVSGSLTRKVQFYTSTLVGQISSGPAYPATILVEDIGPVSGSVPALNPIPAWIPMTLTAPWVNMGGTRVPSAYRKEGDIVRLRLAVKSGTSGSVVFTLPVDYRPPGTVDLFVRDAGSTGVPAGSYAGGIFNINSDGTIMWYGNATMNALIAGVCEYSVTA